MCQFINLEIGFSVHFFDCFKSLVFFSTRHCVLFSPKKENKGHDLFVLTFSIALHVYSDKIMINMCLSGKKHFIIIYIILSIFIFAFVM